MWQSVRSCPFWVRLIFAPMATANCGTCVVSFRVTCYMFPTLLTIYFMCSFSLSSLCQLELLSHLQQSPVPLQFPLPEVVIATDARPTHWAFYFQGSGLPLSVSGSWSGFMCRVHIALQELQAFCLCGKVVALHLDNSMAKAYLCNQCGTVSPFLSMLACWILSLSDKYSITLIPAYIPIHLNVEANYLSQDQMLPEWHLLPQVAQAAFCLWGPPEVTCWHLPIPLNASIITHWNLHYLWGS